MLQRGCGQEGGHFYHIEALVSAVGGEGVRGDVGERGSQLLTVLW